MWGAELREAPAIRVGEGLEPRAAGPNTQGAQSYSLHRTLDPSGINVFRMTRRKKLSSYGLLRNTFKILGAR